MTWQFPVGGNTGRHARIEPSALPGEYGGTFSVGYTVTDTTLSLQFPVAALLATAGLEADDEEEAEVLRIMFKGIEVMTMYFTKG